MLITVFFFDSVKSNAESCDVNGFIQKELTIIAKTAKCVKAADLNGDGLLDVISSSSGDNKLAWYEQTLNDRYIVRIIDSKITGTESFDIGDLDGDGDIDIVAAAYLGNFINWYENDGAGNFTLRSLITAYKLPRAVCIADIDSDGDLDIVSTSSTSKTIDWFDNNGNKTFTKKGVATGITTPWFVTTSDIDEDGDMDVLATARDMDVVILYKNNGSEAFTSQTIDNKADGAECVAVADINNDGNFDIIACSYWDNKIKWYKNDGSLNFTMNLITSAASGVRSIFLDDVDLDNDIDVVYGSYWLDKVAWFENDGTGGFPTEHIVSNDNNGPQFVSCYDLDGDGEDEFLTASSDDNKISWSRNINDSEIVTMELTYPSIGSETSIIADIDSDGDKDVLVTAQMAEIVFWFENLGNNDFLPHDIIKQTKGIRYAEAGDMNNDGYVDIIIGEYYANKISILYNDGAQNFSKTEIATLNGIQCIVINDVNKDGRLDMVTASRNDDKICWFKQNTDGTFTEVVISNTADAASSVEVSDFDKDGNIDILSTSVNDDMSCWYQNDGSGNFTKKKITESNDYPVTISVGDINADGYNDCIIGSRNDNSISYYKNDGSMNFTESVVDGAIGWISNAIVEDLNFDGYPDIVSSASKDNRVQWYKNNKSDGFAKITPPLNGDAKGAFFVDAGDMDLDGDMDVVSSSFSDDKVILYTFSTYKDNIISLIYPANYATDIDITNNMRWSSAINATGYWVQTSLDSTFTTVFSQDTISDTTIAITSLNLEPDNKYYWRVAATNGTCWTSWSQFRSFIPTSSYAKCEIILKSSWNIISSNVLPQNDSLKVILADVKSNVVIIKDASGKFYLPPQNSGTMKFWNSNEGYRIYMSKVDTLQVYGKLIDPTETPVKVKTGWSIIPYLRNSNLNAKDALASILNDFVIVKNSAGKFFIPPSTNQLGDFLVGQGYQMYAKNAVDLYYPANGGGKRAVDEIFIPQTSHYTVNETATGNNASLILSVSLPNDIEIGVFNNNGELIGSGVVMDNSASIALIGDNELTDLIEGALDSEELTIRAYNPNNAEEVTLELLSVSSILSNKEFSKLVYLTNEVYSAKAKTNTDFMLTNELTVSPNPFESNTEIAFTIEKEGFVTLSLYDATGRLVTRIYNEVLSEGLHKYQISSNTFAIGTYRLLLTVGDKIISKELVIVK
jgi:hypothetical protein